MSKSSTFRGEVRELSYDPKFARPRGQTAEQITRDAGRLIAHSPKPDRFYLLRFLGLDAARYIKHSIGQGQA
jgi:hypothetical protein